MSDQPPEHDLERLAVRLRQARGGSLVPEPDKKDKNQSPGSALSLAMRVGVELVSAVAIGVAIGWFLDSQFGTRPWLMLVFIFLGGAAGILNVYRMARGFGYAVGYQQDKETGDDKPRDQGPGIED